MRCVIREHGNIRLKGVRTASSVLFLDIVVGHWGNIQHLISIQIDLESRTHHFAKKNIQKYIFNHADHLGITCHAEVMNT